MVDVSVTSYLKLHSTGQRQVNKNVGIIVFNAMQRRATWDGSPGKPPPSPQATPTSFTTHQGPASPGSCVQGQGQGASSHRPGLFADTSDGHTITIGAFSPGLGQESVHQQVGASVQLPFDPLACRGLLQLPGPNSCAVQRPVSKTCAKELS